jgi:hypothetical protein
MLNIHHNIKEAIYYICMRDFWKEAFLIVTTFQGM